jgi:hypothetical protein
VSKKRMDFYQARKHYETVSRADRMKRIAEILVRRAEIDCQKQKLWSEGEALRVEQMAINFVNDSEDLKCVTPA